MKPLVRWTIGPVLPRGFKSLELSVESVKTFYPECDLLICYNQLKDHQLERVKSLGIKMFDQEQPILPSPKDGYRFEWKICPPRLRLESHEIIIDNDIILFQNVPEIDRFLNDDNVLFSQGLWELYGRYQDKIPAGMRVNAGLFGMPPNFDFAERASEFTDDILGGIEEFDEQGLVTATLLQSPNYYMISQTSITILEDWMSIRPILSNPLCCGAHFVGINYKEKHSAWDEYHRSLGVKFI